MRITVLGVIGKFAARAPAVPAPNIGQFLNKLAAAGRAVAGSAVIAVFLLAGIPEFLVTPAWSPPANPTSYAIHDPDGRALVMTFLPRGRVLMTYSQPSGSIEAALMQVRGMRGLHYFWRLWNVGLSEGLAVGLFGLRVYPAGVEPINIKTTVLKKFTLGTAKPALPEEGRTISRLMLVSEHAVRVEDMWLEEEPTNQSLMQNLLRRLATPGE